MAAPSFLGASTGATDAGGAWTYTAGAATAVGEVVIVQILQDGNTNGAVTVTGASNIEDLAGTDNAWTQIVGPNADGSFPVGSAARQFLYIGRSINNTTGPTISGGNSTSEDLYIQARNYSNVSTGTTIATVLENGSAGTTTNGTGTSTTVADTSVTTTGSDRLAVNYIAADDDITIGVFSGQSGGTWATGGTYAEASGTDGSLREVHATMASAGTIDGGTATVVSAGWGVVGFALIGTTVDAPPYAGLHFPTVISDAVNRASGW